MKNKQNIKLYSVILGMCVILIALCAFMMPKFPTYTLSEASTTNDNPTFIGDDVPYVVIDPGHGGNDNGAVINDIYEDDINLDIALRLYEKCVSNNYIVYLTILF